MAHELFMRYPEKAEGDLTELKSLLVSRPTLHQTAGELGVGGALLLSENEEATGGRNRPSILADALEAILGAVYLDGGYEAVRRIVLEKLIRELPAVASTSDYRNYKSSLLEHVQKQKLGRLVYRTKKEEGPDHEKLFTVEVLLERRVLGEGTGHSKKQAQQEAAKAALVELGFDVNNRVPGVEVGE